MKIKNSDSLFLIIDNIKIPNEIPKNKNILCCFFFNLKIFLQTFASYKFEELFIFYTDDDR